MASVPQSASKWEFLIALGLDCSDSAHKELYSQMKSETSRVYGTTLSRRQNLRPEHASSSPPWSNSQFTDAAIQTAVVKIFNDASAATRPLYRRGRPGGDNWVIKWMVYHVCRYRDPRNKKARSKGFHSDEQLFVPPKSAPPGPSPGSKSRLYDAARDQFRN